MPRSGHVRQYAHATLRRQHVAHDFRRKERASHQCHTFRQRHQFDRRTANIRLFDHQPAAGGEHPRQFTRRSRLVEEVVQRIDHQNTAEEAVGKGQSLHLRTHRVQRPFLARTP